MKVCRGVNVCRNGVRTKLWDGYGGGGKDFKTLMQLRDTSSCAIRKIMYPLSRSVNHHDFPANQSLSEYSLFCSYAYGISDELDLESMFFFSDHAAARET